MACAATAKSLAAATGYVTQVDETCALSVCQPDEKKTRDNTVLSSGYAATDTR
jgi:hypothetical protein